MSKNVDLGDEAQVKEREEKVKIARDRETEELREVLATCSGRAILWRVIALCGIYDAPPTHPQETFRHVGRQDVGRELQRIIFTSDFDAYMVMWQEAEERRLEEEEQND